MVGREAAVLAMMLKMSKEGRSSLGFGRRTIDGCRGWDGHPRAQLASVEGGSAAQGAPAVSVRWRG